MKKSIFILAVLILSIQLVSGQNDKMGLKLINISVGPSFSNFINSEAPHKINIYGSDIYPVIIYSDVTNSMEYYDYKTSLLKDIKLGLSIGLGFEYYFKNDLAIYFSLYYEEKGIDLRFEKHESTIYEVESNSPSSPQITEPQTRIAYYDENYDTEISNSYLTLPILFRKYIHHKNFYLQGGIYAGYLLQSQIYTHQRKHKYDLNSDFNSYDYQSGIDNEIDKEKKFTTNFDFGFSLGAGYSHPISEKFLLNANLILNLGLRKIDKKYNNEYYEDFGAGGAGVKSSFLTSTNYYGLNSNARNINSSITVGMVYKL